MAFSLYTISTVLIFVWYICVIYSPLREFQITESVLYTFLTQKLQVGLHNLSCVAIPLLPTVMWTKQAVTIQLLHACTWLKSN